VPHSMQGQNLDDFPNLKRWYEELRARPATQRGFAVMAEEVEKMRAAAQQPQQDKKSWEILFGNKQFEKR
jgi:GSH-dependent disulfide-bond oxidoreductase